MLKRIPVLAFALMCLLSFGTLQAQTSEITPAQRAEFARMVQQRNQLHQKLATLDSKAAKAIKDGKAEPVALHAEQIQVQDELDLVSFKLDLMATRYDLSVPAIPQPGAEGEQARDSEATKRAKKAFDRGRNRALAEIRTEAREMRAAIDFTRFLAQ